MLCGFLACYMLRLFLQLHHPLEAFEINMYLKNSKGIEILTCNQDGECMYYGQRKLINTHLEIGKTH